MTQANGTLTRIVLCLGASIALALGAAQIAAAAIITFDDVVVPSPNAIINGSETSGGFGFTSDHWHVNNFPTNCGLGGCVSDGTQYAAEDAPRLAFPVTMTAIGGGTFSLFSFDGAELWLNDADAILDNDANAAFIHVVGNLFGGGTITGDFALDGIKDGAGGAADFQNFVFGAGWTNLTSVVWSGLTVAGAPASMSFDNIRTSVPEPSTLLLLGAGVLGLALRRRSRAR
jgi:hypothetical protein